MNGFVNLLIFLKSFTALMTTLESFNWKATASLVVYTCSLAFYYTEVRGTPPLQVAVIDVALLTTVVVALTPIKLATTV